MTVPLLEGDALAAVRHRGSHVQIIAAAGSGKTEVVAQRGCPEFRGTSVTAQWPFRPRSQCS
ncbi:MAG: UvrD-helicase domain-containing protein, partial [Acidimicrobiales bacterium]